jgi:hypothetical protein
MLITSKQLKTFWMKIELAVLLNAFEERGRKKNELFLKQLKSV